MSRFADMRFRDGESEGMDGQGALEHAWVAGLTGPGSGLKGPGFCRAGSQRSVVVAKGLKKMVGRKMDRDLVSNSSTSHVLYFRGSISGSVRTTMSARAPPWLSPPPPTVSTPLFCPCMQGT